MQIQINQASKTEHGNWFDATCGKTSAWVAISKNGVQVCTKNAAHRAWGGFGKHFPTVADAVANYKSAEMKAIIEAAAEVAQ